MDEGQNGNGREIHKLCSMHSSHNTRLSLNLWFGGVGLLLLSTLLVLVIDTHSAVTNSSYRLMKMESVQDAQELRLRILEIKTGNLADNRNREKQ
jgi:hypothetical protein